MTNYSVQLYSVRDTAEKNLSAAISAVSAIGYTAVEFAGFFGHTAEEIKTMLDENHIAVSGTHTGWQELLPDRIDKTISFHKAIGNRFIIVPGGDFSTSKKLDDFIGLIKSVAPRLEKEGITLGYHNHAHEFRPNTDGLYIYDELLERTDVKLEIDTYFTFVARKNTFELMEKYRDRVISIHLKDGGENGEYGCSLGSGKAPVAKVREKALELGIPMVVESESLTPDGISEVKRCFDYLKTLEA